MTTQPIEAGNKEEGEKMHNYITTSTAEKLTKTIHVNKEIDGSVEKPVSFRPMVQPNRKCDDEKPLRDRSNL